MTTFAFWNDVNKIILFVVNTSNQNRVWLIVVAAYLADASEKCLVVSKCQTPDVSCDNRPNIELDYSNVQYGDSIDENSSMFSTKTAAYKLIKWSQW